MADGEVAVLEWPDVNLGSPERWREGRQEACGTTVNSPWRGHALKNIPAGMEDSMPVSCCELRVHLSRCTDVVGVLLPGVRCRVSKPSPDHGVRTPLSYTVPMVEGAERFSRATEGMGVGGQSHIPRAGTGPRTKQPDPGAVVHNTMSLLLPLAGECLGMSLPGTCPTGRAPGANPGSLPNTSTRTSRTTVIAAPSYSSFSLSLYLYLSRPAPLRPPG